MDYTTEFNLDPDITYLNHAAVAPWPKRSCDALHQFVDENQTLGATRYLQWLTVESQLKSRLKWLLNATSVDEIALVKNTSEALSVIAYGLEWKSGDNIVSCYDEFPSNRIVWESLKSRGVELRLAEFNGQESPEDAIIKLVSRNTRMMTVSSVQYATGLKLDLERLGQYCKQHHILFCVDAIQSLGALPFDVQSCQADFVMADGHKWMLGPEGLAVLYVNKDQLNQIKLNQFGWHMIQNQGDFDQREWQPAGSARRFECGSPNMLGIHALNASLSLLQKIGMNVIESKIIDNVIYINEKINKSNKLTRLPHHMDELKSGIITFAHKACEGSTVYQYLMKNNVICANRGGGVRFSPHFYTSTADIERAFQFVEQL